MTQIKWQQAFETGISQVDEQHKKLVEMINRLDASLHHGVGNVTEQVGKVLISLVDYTKYHFDTEEKIMKEIGFEFYQQHFTMHEELRHQIVSILKRLKEGETVGVYEMLSFLSEWLVSHILEEDRKIGKAYAQVHLQTEKAQ